LNNPLLRYGKGSDIEHKVEVEMRISGDMIIRQTFTKVIDTKEEAEEFGAESAAFAFHFSQGFGEFDFEYES
jgi:hypothetical protein